MYQSDHLTFIHMQKTGGSHIVNLLKNILPGVEIGRHNAATAAQIRKFPFFVSSIRNPWDWYVSLWAYGVQGKGAFANRLTNRNLLYPVKSALRNPQDCITSFREELSKDVNTWREAYRDSDDVLAFRKWLKMIHNPKNSFLLGEGYGSSSITQWCGLMTYRYLNMCCINTQELSDPDFINDIDNLADFDHHNNYVNFFIRQENLEQGLCEAISRVRPLTSAEQDLIFAKQRTNASKRNRSVAEYYDDETIDLVLQRDRLLVEKFEYAPAVCAAG